MYWGKIKKCGDICWINVKKSNDSSKLKGQRISKYGFCFIDYTKAFDYVDHNKLENSSSDGNNRPSYLPPEKPMYRSRSNRTGHETMGWFTIVKEVGQGCIL